MNKPWDTTWGCPVGVVAQDKVYCLTFGGSSKRMKGMACYVFEVFSLAGERLKLENVPSNRTLRRLAKKFLGCDCVSLFKREISDMGFFVDIASKIPHENLSAFLSAVVVNGLQ